MTRLLSRLWLSSTQRVMTLSGAGMVLALLADVLIARRLGFTATTDALLIALTLPRLIGTVGRDATKFSLMTVFIETQRSDGDDAFKDLGARVLNLFLVIGLVLTIAGLLLAGPIVSIVGWGLDPGGRELSATLLRLSAGIAVFALGSAVLEVMLNSRKHFTVTAIRNAVVPTLVIAATVATWRNDDDAPYTIAGAFTAGYAVYFLTLVYQASRRLRFTPNPTRWPGRSTFNKLRGTIGYPLAGFGIRQTARVIERAIASLGPEGSVAAFYYAYRLLAAIQNLVGVSVALTGQPKLTEHDLDGDRTRFIKALRQRIGIILIISIPAAALLMLLHRQIIALLYGQGGLSAERLADSASVLLILGPAAIFYCLTPVLNSALYAQKRYGTVLYNMCLAAGTNVLLAFVLFKGLGLNNVELSVLTNLFPQSVIHSMRSLLAEGMGVQGIAWAALIAAVLSVINLLWLATRTTHRQQQTPST
jgi:putative peptidoglycan lipid II flippase